MRAGYTIHIIDYVKKPLEVQVGNYPRYNEIIFYHFEDQTTEEDDERDNIIGRWNIKYK